MNNIVDFVVIAGKCNNRIKKGINFDVTAQKCTNHKTETETETEAQCTLTFLFHVYLHAVITSK